MSYYVTDTHSLYWYLINSPLLRANASAAFDEADQGAAKIYISAIVLAELYYLNKKHGSPINFAATFGQLQQSPQFEFLPFNPEEVLEFTANAAVPEMHDRMIAGVAKRLNIPCLTCDKQIVGSGLVQIVW
jgi:PIN domain nuclease of toxin-antitoxin system